jgi:hypothetical protein
MTRRSTIVAIALLLGAGCGSKSDRWSEATENNMVSSCRSSATAAGSDAAAAEANCACVLRGLEATYTEAQFGAIEAEMKRKGTSSLPAEMLKIVEECRESPKAH